MYKNFNITEEEKQQIMEMHQSHGYKQPLNEQQDPHYIFGNLVKRYQPFGFKVQEFPSVQTTLSKGDDVNGAFINQIKNGNKLAWGVNINGENLLFREGTPNGSNETGLFNQIIKDIDKYRNYKF